MITVTCDVCKKKLDNPITGRDFFYFAEHSLCEACRDNLEAKVKTIVREKSPFSFEWYAKFVDDSCVKAASKGK